MQLDFFETFEDPFLKTEMGKGVFLAGVVLGMLARGQIGKDEPIDKAPLFKQLNFGRVQRRDLMRHFARIPVLTRAYGIEYSGMIESLAAQAGELLLKGQQRDLGVDGNFAFSVAFMNAPHFFWKKIFKKREEEKEEDQKE